MRKKTWIKIILHEVVIFTILCVALLPAVSVATAGQIANANGCQLDEGSIHPCVVNGEDMGETLYTMGMMGWLLIATIPLGLGAAGLYILLVAAFYIIRSILRRKKQNPAGKEEISRE